MSELKLTRQSHADNDISLAWGEYEKCGEVGNYAENLLHAAEFYQTESKAKEQENQLLSTDRENAISLMSPSWKHAASKEPDLITRYVTMAENQLKKKNKEIERLTEIATKHATRADELYEALEMCIEALERSYDATEWPADGSSQQEVTAAQCREVLDRARIDAVSNPNDD